MYNNKKEDEKSIIKSVRIDFVAFLSHVHYFFPFYIHIICIISNVNNIFLFLLYFFSLFPWHNDNNFAWICTKQKICTPYLTHGKRQQHQHFRKHEKKRMIHFHH